LEQAHVKIFFRVIKILLPSRAAHSAITHPVLPDCGVEHALLAPCKCAHF
jgi:hypothetical protein